MAVTEFEYKKGFPAIRLTHPNNTSTVELVLYGAHVYSWTVKNKEILFLSDKAIFEQGKAIRGGVPLVWPQFGPGPLPQHGFARVRPWHVTNKSTTGGDVSVELQLSDDEETLKLWPNKFTLTLTVRLSANSLVQELAVENRDEKSFEFTALYHTYFNVEDIKTTKVSGLKNVTYVDKVDGAKTKTETNEAIEFTGETDRVYTEGGKNNNPIVINDRLEVTGSSTMPDVVVWNPWQEKAKAAADIGEQNYPKYVCVEVGHVGEPVKLEQGQSWKGSHQMTVLH